MKAEGSRSGEHLDVPGHPDVPGLVFRSCRGEEDAAHFADVWTRCMDEDGLLWVRDTAYFQNLIRNLVNCDPATDIILAEVEGSVVGNGKVNWAKEIDGSIAYWISAMLLPDWRNRGILRAMLLYLEGRSREMALGADSTGPQRTRTFLADSELHQISVVEEMGYNKERYFFEMLRDLAEEIVVHPLPGGIEVRPAGPDDHRKVFEADWEANRDHWAWREMEEEDYRRFIEDRYFQPDLWNIGWDGEEVAGLVVAWIDEDENERFGRKWGYPDMISVRRPYRRRGLAKALLSRSLLMLRDRGMEKANLGVDTENPNQALNLYEGVGFKVMKRHFVYSKMLE
jgi:ribosomal protein S18 acetylase RimI-like enzyme